MLYCWLRQAHAPKPPSALSALLETALSLPSLTLVDIQRVDVNLLALKRFTGEYRWEVGGAAAQFLVKSPSVHSEWEQCWPAQK
jgi:hypothetical protein